MTNYIARQPIPITDPDDPRVEPYRAVRERDLVGRDGRFIAEGEVVLRVFLANSAHRIETLLLAENRIAPLTDLLSSLPASVPVYTASRTVMDRIAGFPIHRGVLAMGRRGVETSAKDLVSRLPDRSLVVGVVGLANHDNVGGVFRNAAAFGVDAVLLDPGTCDPLYRKAIRVSVGASLMVPFARVDNADIMVDMLRGSGFEVLALSPSGRERLADVQRAPRTALILGAEGPGLPPSLLARTHTAAIPMAGGFDSLNVATTSGIALYHLAEPSGSP